MCARIIKNRGLVYIRQSRRCPETSLNTQLELAAGAAERLGVEVDAAAADLEYMRANSMHTYKSICLEDSITGTDPTR